MIFKFRALSGGEEKFARDYEISDDSTLWDLHDHIQEDLGFNPDQMASFFTVDEEWNKIREFTLFDMGEDDSESLPLAMDRAVIRDIVSQKKQRLLYTFDVFNDRGLFLELLDIKEPETGIEYPYTSLTIGEAPLQIEDVREEGSIYDDIMEDFDDFESYEEHDERSDDDY